MPKIILDAGYLNVSIRYLYRKPATGLLYYHRRIPSDLVEHYGQELRRVSLKTRDEGVAARKIAQLAERDDAEWEALRSPEGKAGDIAAAKTRSRARALMGALGLSEGEGHPTGRNLDARERASQAVERLDDHFSKRYPNWEQARHDETFHLRPEDLVHAGRGRVGTASDG